MQVKIITDKLKQYNKGGKIPIRTDPTTSQST